MGLVVGFTRFSVGLVVVFYGFICGFIYRFFLGLILWVYYGFIVGLIRGFIGGKKPIERKPNINPN